MKHSGALSALLCAAALAASAADTARPADAEEGVRTIKLLQDDGQVRIVSKLYELKHIKATELRPFVEAAIKRYSSRSLTERVNYVKAGRQMIIVSTGEDFMPYVDKIVAALDRPVEADKTGSIIAGTGVTRIDYTPSYRAADDIARILNKGEAGSPEGKVFINADTNTIYLKDDMQAANWLLSWIKYLDRPVPQANIRLNYYEIRESKLRDIGIDYLAWKNGPGLDIFSAGFDAGSIFSNETIYQLISGATKLADITKDFSTSWSYGAFLTAPAFDMSFVRVLQQSGNAKLAAHADLTVVGTAIYEDPALNGHLPRVYSATLIPGYENISKDDDDRTAVAVGGDSTLTVALRDPVICFNYAPEERGKRGEIPTDEKFYRNADGVVIFAYDLDSKTVTERSNRGDELGNSSTVNGELTLGFRREKLLATFVREQDVEETIGIPFLVKIPVLKYLFGTTTTIKERTYIIVTAEATPMHPDGTPPPEKPAPAAGAAGKEARK